MNVINHVGRRSSYRYKERSRLCASILRELVDLSNPFAGEGRDGPGLWKQNVFRFGLGETTSLITDLFSFASACFSHCESDLIAPL